MKRTNKLLLSVMLIMLMCITACSTNTVQNESATVSVLTETAADDSQSSSETVYPVTITGTDGNQITLDAEPEKIVSIAPNITELVFALGAENILAGRTTYCDYPDGVEQIDTIGTLRSPDIEKIVSLQPDLVIVSTHSEDSIKALTDAGLTVLSLYEEHDVSGVYGMITTLGSALNKNAEAAAIVEDMQDKIAGVSEKIASLEPVDVYYVVGFGEGGEYTAGGDTFINGILTAAGGNNIAADVSGWSYSLETLIEKDPSVIILSENDYDTFTTTEPYSQLTAVKEGRVYTIDTNMLDRQCNRNADAIVEIAAMLHPEAFH